MGLFASSILVKYSLLNNSGSLVYAGNSSLSLRIWGAQLELAEYSEDILNDYIQNYRYTRTTGIEHNFIGLRFGSGAGGDPSTDFIIIGGTSGDRHTSFGLETQNFFVDKAPRELIFAGQQYRFDTRLSGDPMERLVFNYRKRVELNTIKYNLTSDYYQAIAYGTSGGFVAVTNPINSGTVATFATSEDGTTWRQVNTSQQGSWVDIIYGKAGYLAVAQFTSIAVLGNATSPKTWNNLNSWSSVTLPFRADNWSLAASPDLYLAVPAYTSTVTSVVARSHNGSTWTTANVGIAANWAAAGWSSSLSSWVIIAHNTSIVVVSKNASTWSSIDTGYSANWQDIAASPDGVFMAVAAYTSIAIYSLTTTSWLVTTLPVSSVWTGITYADGMFVAVNERTQNAAKTQANTTSWTDLHGFNGTDVAYGSYRWVFVNSKQHRWDRNKKDELEYVSDVFENNPNWYQLAPYRSTFAERTYASSALIQPQKENPLNDFVTIGENSQTRMQTGESNLENVRFFRTRNINEGETISQVPKYDAAQIMELFYRKSGRNIDPVRWSPTDGNYVYLDIDNWYSITPLTSRSKYAFDEYGNRQVTITEQPVILDVNSSIGLIPTTTGSLYVASLGIETITRRPDINNIDTLGLLNGVVRMTSYLNFDYMAEDYVGESRIILY